MILPVALTLLLLAGCSTSYVEPVIDARLTRDCDSPELTGDTWRDIAALAVEQKAAIAECTARMRVIRKAQSQ